MVVTICVISVNSPFLQLLLLHPAADGRGTSGGLSSSGCCCHPSEPQWRSSSYTSSTPGGWQDTDMIAGWKEETSEQMAINEQDTLTLCCRRRKGSSISMPPSWTTHHTSMVPSASRSWLLGKLSTFLATSKAWWAVVVSRTVSAWTRISDRM